MLDLAQTQIGECFRQKEIYSEIVWRDFPSKSEFGIFGIFGDFSEFLETFRNFLRFSKIFGDFSVFFETF